MTSLHGESTIPQSPNSNEIDSEISRLADAIFSISRSRNALRAIAAVLWLAALLTYALNVLYPTPPLLAITGAIAVLLTLSTSSHEIDARLQKLLVEREYHVDKLSDGQKIAEKHFRISQLELKRHYDLTVVQNKLIFFVGVCALVMGFVAVYYSYRMFQDVLARPSVSESSILFPIASLITGVLSNFVAVVYLKVHEKTLGALKDFHAKLADVYQLQFGFLVSQYSGDPEVLRSLFSSPGTEATETEEPQKVRRSSKPVRKSKVRPNT